MLPIDFRWTNPASPALGEELLAFGDSRVARIYQNEQGADWVVVLDTHLQPKYRRRLMRSSLAQAKIAAELWVQQEQETLRVEIQQQRRLRDALWG